LQPDLIALTGDFTFAGKHYAEPCAEALALLRARVGTYAVLGNHDHYNSAGRITRALRHVGITVLVDERERLERRGDKLWLVGVDDLAHGIPADLPRLLRDVPADESRVTLAHNPEYLDVFAGRGQHTDFMLSGHTHGGQIRFPLLGAPHVIGQRYIMGLNSRGPMQIYTSRGIGTVGPPVRLNCPPEVALYTLRQGAVA
jgi:predicted MPP superfamily phosphohydrolase